MVNPDCARSKLEKMCQKEGESVAKRGFMDPDDVIGRQILQTMRDKKPRLEAMVKRYTLQQLLEHAAKKEDSIAKLRIWSKSLHRIKTALTELTQRESGNQRINANPSHRTTTRKKTLANTVV